MVRIWWDFEEGRYRLKTPYDAEFVDDLKDCVFYQGRSWDGVSKTWLFDRDYLENVCQLCSEYFGNVSVTGNEKEQAHEQYPSEPVGELQNASIALIRLLPEEILHTAYRSAMKSLHPDVGGDTAKAQEFNQAYQAIVKLLHKKTPAG